MKKIPDNSLARVETKDLEVKKSELFNKESLKTVESYVVNYPYAEVEIHYDEAHNQYYYHVNEPWLSLSEKDLFQCIRESLFDNLVLSRNECNVIEAIRELKKAYIKILSKIRPPDENNLYKRMFYYLQREFFGFGFVDAMMHDPFIEDISCDGAGKPIFVYHMKYESMRSNLIVKDSGELDMYIMSTAQKAGKYISIAEPLADATLNDGSRIQMSLGDEVTAHGSTFTIRKFRSDPITPVDLINSGTLTPQALAYLWLCVESAKSCIFAGGTASGKTTLLNAVSLFIPPQSKIVSLEDTRELRLPHENWIPAVTRHSADLSRRGEIDLYDLLVAALRQRPEYIIVGEVRGKEAQTLFQAMNTGHVTYSTIHADTVSGIVYRLENPPLSVPRTMLSSLDLVCIQVQVRIGGRRVRRTKHIIEILEIDPRTRELITNEVFRWEPDSDELVWRGRSFLLDLMTEERTWTAKVMQEELKRREETLVWMMQHDIRTYREVAKTIECYLSNPQNFFRGR